MLKLGDMQIHESLWEVLYVMKYSLGVPSVMLGSSNFVYFRYTGGVRNFGYFFAVCLVVYLNKHNIDNDVFVS